MAAASKKAAGGEVKCLQLQRTHSYCCGTCSSACCACCACCAYFGDGCGACCCVCCASCASCCASYALLPVSEMLHLLWQRECQHLLKKPRKGYLTFCCCGSCYCCGCCTPSCSGCVLFCCNGDRGAKHRHPCDGGRRQIAEASIGRRLCLHEESRHCDSAAILVTKLPINCCRARPG
jgi:hypothetical protein